MTKGPMLKTAVRFCVPLIIGGLLQCFYNAADLIVVGRFASADALAAVGATSPITGMLINIFVSLSVGTSILLARAYGARDEEKTRRIISTSYAFSLILGLVIASAGQLLVTPLLVLSDCPGGVVIDGARLYLRIILIGTPAQLFYNFMCNVIRADGDSKRPLVYLALSGIVNVVLNLFLVIVLGMDVAGVAVATVVSQYLSASLLFIKLIRLEGAKRLMPLRSFTINGKQLLRILRLGVPSSVSSSMYSIANFQIMSAINAFGSYATAGNAAAVNIESFFTTMTGSLATAASALVGQNIGAGNRERVNSVITRFYLAFVPTLGLIGLLAPIFSEPLLALYLSSSETAAIEFAKVRFWCVSAFLFLNAFMNINSGTLQAFGYTTYAMLISIVGVCGFRTLWMLAVYPHFKTPLGLYSCFTVSWLIVCVVGTVTVTVLRKRYKSGKLNV